MTRQIELVLPYPISANRYWAHRIVTPKDGRKPMAMTYVTNEARAYKEHVGWLAAKAGITKPLQGRVAVEVQLYPNRPQDWQTRMRKLGPAWDDSVQCIDLGNCEKVLSDALKDVVFCDDRWLWDIHLRRMEPVGEGRVVVIIRPLAVQQPQAAIAMPEQPAVA